MFGLLPLLRGLLFAAVIVAAAVAVGWIAWTLFVRVLRAFGVDLAELEAYRERRRIYADQLRQLEGQLPRLEITSAEFEQASHTLHAFQASEPVPPRWAFWLEKRDPS